MLPAKLFSKYMAPTAKSSQISAAWLPNIAKLFLGGFECFQGVVRRAGDFFTFSLDRSGEVCGFCMD
jgi:hypothetical protein